MGLEGSDDLELAKRQLRDQIERDQERHDYVILWRRYDDGDREWDEYHLMTRTSAQMVLMSVPLYEPHCKRAKICTLEMDEVPSDLGDYPWT
jgi:hypothetical protein